MRNVRDLGKMHHLFRYDVDEKGAKCLVTGKGQWTGKGPIVNCIACSSQETCDWLGEFAVVSPIPAHVAIDFL